MRVLLLQVKETCAEALQGLGGGGNLCKAAQLYRQRLRDVEQDGDDERKPSLALL